MIGLLLKPEKQKISEYDYSTHKDIEKAVNSIMFSVVYRHIGTDKSPIYTIYIDDIGRFRNPQYTSAFNTDDSTRLVGNLLIARTDAYGNDVDLTDNDIKLIKESLVTMYDYDRGIKTLGLFPIYYPTKRH